MNKSDFYYEENLERQLKVLQQENQQLKEQLDIQKDDFLVANEEVKKLKDELHKCGLEIQEMTERDLFCPSFCNKLKQKDERIERYKTRLKTVKRRRKKQTQKIKIYQELITNMQHSLEQKNKVIDEAIDKIRLIIALGFDYDGFNNVDSLKGLIDELVGYSRECLEILQKYKGDNK